MRAKEDAMEETEEKENADHLVLEVPLVLEADQQVKLVAQEKLDVLEREGVQAAEVRREKEGVLVV